MHMATIHTTVTGAQTIRWQIDQQVVTSVMRWAKRRPEALTADLEGMEHYFPSWMLVGASAGRTVSCAACHLPCVPTNNAIRCPLCGAQAQADALIWVGLLPALARPEKAFLPKRQALRQIGFDEVTTAGGDYLLIPLSVAYPSEWPHVEPLVRYAPRWLAAAGIPIASAAHHLIGNGQACIYAYSQWQAAPVHTVLQQRMVNHATSLLKIAAGQSPQQAFIGRIHHDHWEPDGSEPLNR
jgi:hypothetical protein